MNKLDNGAVNHICKNKTMEMNLNSNSIGIIFDVLDVKNVEEILEKDFADITEQNDIEREKATLYSSLVRGSARLNRGLYYTTKEYEEKRRKIIANQLP
jgi:hypothetical protein